MRGELEARYEMIGTSAPIQKLFQDIDKVAPTKASVLITGESGTGKELVSRAIHQLSPRKDAPFVKVNCAAIPRELIESELFGHEKGSFTGAQARKRGFFEQAHGGTLFLDEIGDMDLTAQAKVLRALQNGEVVRVGSEHVINVDVRVLAATNKDLGLAVKQGSFREDLFFRLDVFPIALPALRERKLDVALLAEALRFGLLQGERATPKAHRSERVRGPRSAKVAGQRARVEDVVERAAILSSDVITIADLPEDPHESPFDDEPTTAARIPQVIWAARPTARPLPQAQNQAPSDRLTLREYRNRPSARTSSTRSRRSTGTSAKRPSCSASSARTCTKKCAPTASSAAKDERASETASDVGALNQKAPAPIFLSGRAPGVVAFSRLWWDHARGRAVRRSRRRAWLGGHRRVVARPRQPRARSGSDALRRLDARRGEHVPKFAGTGPVIAAGLSLGSLMAAHLAITYPKRVAGLVMLANAAWLRPSLAWALRAGGLLGIPDFMMRKGGSDIADLEARSSQISYTADPCARPSIWSAPGA